MEATPAFARPVELFGAFETFQPSREIIWDWWRRNFDPRHEGKSHLIRDMNVEVAIWADDAQRGGRIAIDVPIGALCEQCGGTGSTGYFTCDACGGHGMFWETHRVDVLLSPPVRNGMVMPVSLRHLGVRNLNLRVHVRVVL